MNIQALIQAASGLLGSQSGSGSSPSSAQADPFHALSALTNPAPPPQAPPIDPDVQELANTVGLEGGSVMDLQALLQAASGILGSPPGAASSPAAAAQAPTNPSAALLADPGYAAQIAANPFLANPAYVQAAAIASSSIQGIDPDVQELADHFGLDERITKQLDNEMKNRQDTFEGDLLALWDILEHARSPPGLLSVKIKEMQAGTFVGQPTIDKDIKEFQRMYKLDDQATRKLAEVLHNRKETREQDIELMHRHLETSNKPSARVMMMLGKLRSGEPLPEPDKRIAPGSYLDRKEREKEREKEEARNGRGRSRDRRRSGRSRSRDHRRSRSRDRRRSSRSRERERERRNK